MKHDELVKALRYCADSGGMVNCNTICEYGWRDSHGCKNLLMTDAAGAIEELQSILTEADKKQAYQHDYICELVAEKEELQAETERLKAQLPKRGKWIVHTEVKNIYGGICIECPVCRDHFVVLNVSDEKYCRSCGAKMEVQDG